MTPLITALDIQTWLGPQIDDDTAAVLVINTSDAVQGYIERDVGLQTVTELLDSNGSDTVLASFWPIRSISSITINGGQQVPAAAFNVRGYRLDKLVERAIIFPGQKIGRSVSNIAVTYVAGYDTSQSVGSALGIPGDLHLACKLTANAISNAQAADTNLASENTGGVFSGSFYATGAGAVPPGARTLLQRFKRVAP